MTYDPQIKKGECGWYILGELDANQNKYSNFSNKISRHSKFYVESKISPFPLFKVTEWRNILHVKTQRLLLLYY